jgi:hypothetical protein
MFEWKISKVNTTWNTWGNFATHINEHMMTRQIQRARYFWMTIERNCIDYIRKCHKCQVHGDKINTPSFSLFNKVSYWSFTMWVIDVIELINSKANNGHKVILVAIDYFTKWIKTCSYAHVTQKVVRWFIKKELICQYGLLKRIVTDNAQNFNEKQSLNYVLNGRSNIQIHLRIGQRWMKL